MESIIQANQIHQEVYKDGNETPEAKAFRSLEDYFKKAESRISEDFPQNKLSRHEFELSIPEDPNIVGDDMLEYLTANGVLRTIAFLRTYNSSHDGKIYSELNLIKKPHPKEYDFNKDFIKSFFDEVEDEISKTEIYKGPSYSERNMSYLKGVEGKNFLEDRLHYLTHDEKTMAMAFIKESPKTEIVLAKSY